jgi:hypothetical protein
MKSIPMNAYYTLDTQLYTLIYFTQFPGHQAAGFPLWRTPRLCAGKYCYRPGKAWGWGKMMSHG